jgi:hypothetical protein
MKVSELIEILSNCDQDAEVHFTYNYGDHWRTTVAPSIDDVEPGWIKDSEYHRMPVECELDDDGNEPEDIGAKEVVLLRPGR